MAEKPIPSKNEEARRKEAELLRAETERSIEVARAKLAHGTIEAIERLRKASAIHSLHKRVDIHVGETEVILSGLKASLEKRDPFPLGAMEILRGLMKTYESIRADFKEIMELNDEKLERLFPKINPNFKTQTQGILILNDMVSQETQMMAYSLRMRP